MEISDEIREALQYIAEGVTEVAGFRLAAISVVGEGMLHTVAVAGDESAKAELMQLRAPVEALMAELAAAESWGPLRFLPHQLAGPHLDEWAWVPEIDAVDEVGRWHPLDLLCGLLHDADGTLRGVLSMDLPVDGRLPDQEKRRILQIYARQAERAVITALERGDFEAGMRRERTIAEYRRQIIDVLSHELHNSVAAIANTVEILRTDPEIRDLPERVTRGLGAVDRGAQRIRAVVDDMLLLAKLGSADDQLHWRTVDLAALARDAVAVLAADAAIRGIELSVDGSPTRMLGDAGELDRLVTNLVSNAIKYSDPGGAVTVHVSTVTDTGEAELTVTDRGIGIATQEQDRIYDEFFRSGDSNARRRPGTGLGLAIVSRVVQRHRGAITVESGLGIGTAFRVRLPAG